MKKILKKDLFAILKDILLEIKINYIKLQDICTRIVLTIL